MNTSFERVNDLERLSSRVYDVIDQRVQGEPRYRKMLRLALNLLDDELNHGNSLEASGELLIASINDQLERGGLSVHDPAYAAYPNFQEFSQSLPTPPTTRTTALDTFANRYADVRRATLDREGSLETDGRHAIHLMALAVPYALEYYPRLSPGIIAADSALHDSAEVITGDTPTFGMSHEAYQAKVAMEQGAMPQLKKELGPEHAPLFAVIQEYEEQRKPEDGYTKTLDKEDAYFTHLDNKGHQFIHRYGIHSANEFLASTVPTTQRIQRYRYSFPLLREDRAEFIRRLAEITEWPIAN